MRFPMPHHPCEFEIPDDWLREAGAIGFTPITTSYRSRSSPFPESTRTAARKSATGDRADRRAAARRDGATSRPAAAPSLDQL
jgi:hypothetical protein